MRTEEVWIALMLGMELPESFLLVGCNQLIVRVIWVGFGEGG